MLAVLLEPALYQIYAIFSFLNVKINPDHVLEWLENKQTTCVRHMVSLLPYNGNYPT